MMDFAKKDNPGRDPGGTAYVHSKRALSAYVHDLATELAPRGIRANVVHPTTSTPRCSRANRCTACFDQIWSTPLAKTRSPCLLCNRQ